MCCVIGRNISSVTLTSSFCQSGWTRLSPRTRASRVGFFTFQIFLSLCCNYRIHHVLIWLWWGLADAHVRPILDENPGVETIQSSTDAPFNNAIWGNHSPVWHFHPNYILSSQDMLSWYFIPFLISASLSVSFSFLKAHFVHCLCIHTILSSFIYLGSLSWEPHVIPYYFYATW